mgnify:FL=1
MRYRRGSFLLSLLFCSCASMPQMEEDRAETMFLPGEARSDVWGFDPEKEIPRFFDVNEWIPMVKIQPWTFTIEKDTEEALEFTIGYTRAYVSRYSNVEGLSYHAFFSPAPSLLAWRVASKNPRDGWLALEGEDGKWHRSRWGTKMEVQLSANAITLRAQSIVVTIKTGEVYLSRTFDNK